MIAFVNMELRADLNGWGLRAQHSRSMQKPGGCDGRGGAQVLNARVGPPPTLIVMFAAG
jgi:hypothetical protein